MANDEPLPAAFDPVLEPNKFLTGIKKRAATKFSRKKQASLENAMRLAYWLFVSGKDDETLEVCRFLGAYEFAGNFNLWSWIEYTLALQSRILRLRGEEGESAESLRRIRAAGFVPSRLTGSLLDDKLKRVHSTASEGDKTGERDWSLLALLELCVLIELGGSETWPVTALEEELQQVVARLRPCCKV
jgi:hypothetical protein